MFVQHINMLFILTNEIARYVSYCNTVRARLTCVAGPIYISP